jgi:hypothetical protein
MRVWAAALTWAPLLFPLGIATSARVRPVAQPRHHTHDGAAQGRARAGSPGRANCVRAEPGGR